VRRALDVIFFDEKKLFPTRRPRVKEKPIAAHVCFNMGVGIAWWSRMTFA
jgi:hypothetical protein